MYEGMFLLDSGRSGDWNQAAAHVHGILTRYGATIVDSRKWDERRLAYEIKGRKRGTYMLVYFDAPRPSMVSIRRDLELSETVLRYLILARDRYAPAEVPEPSALGAEGGSDEDEGRGGRGHGRPHRPRRDADRDDEERPRRRSAGASDEDEGQDSSSDSDG